MTDRFNSISIQFKKQNSLLRFREPISIPKVICTMKGEGVMRLATAFDEIAPMKEPRVQNNPGCLVVILFSD